MMSSQIDQQEKFADSLRTCSLTTENSECQSSSNLFVKPEVGSEPCDEGEFRSKKSLKASTMQEISGEDTENIGLFQDELSDSILLLDANSSRSNGESSFENEIVLQVDDSLQSLVQAEVDFTRKFVNKEENLSQCLDNTEKDSQIAIKSRKSVQPQQEIILNPLSICAETSRTPSSSREEKSSNPSWSARFSKPTSTIQDPSPIAQCGREELEDDATSRIHFIKVTDTGEHPNQSSEHGRVELGANFPSSERHIWPTGTRIASIESAEHGREKLGADPPCSVRFIKPTGMRQHASPTKKCGRENRDIFETGGDQSKYPPARVSCTGEEVIELLPGESPEPQVIISPSSSATSSFYSCKVVEDFFCRWWSSLTRRPRKQFAKAPMFYFLSTCIILIGINAWDREWLDRDIAMTIVTSFLTFVVITLLVDRGQFSHAIGGQNSCIAECKRGCRNADTCIPWCCFSSPEPLEERHSQYRHLEEDGAFRHEIADVSNLDPKDCPQMKMVEQREYEHAESPDCVPDVSQVDADVHVEKRDGEKLGAARKHLGRPAEQVKKPHKTRSAMFYPKAFRADIHGHDQVISDPPELSPIRETAYEDQTQNGDGQLTIKDASSGEDLGGELSKITTYSSTGVFKKFSECSPTLSRFANFRQSDCFRDETERSTSPEDECFYEDDTQDFDAEEFMCEHYGQSVACSCPTLLAKAKENARR